MFKISWVIWKLVFGPTAAADMVGDFGSRSWAGWEGRMLKVFCCMRLWGGTRRWDRKDMGKEALKENEQIVSFVCVGGA